MSRFWGNEGEKACQILSGVQSSLGVRKSATTTKFLDGKRDLQLTSLSLSLQLSLKEGGASMSGSGGDYKLRNGSVVWKRKLHKKAVISGGGEFLLQTGTRSTKEPWESEFYYSPSIPIFLPRK